jgi:hypothetical protein
LDCNGSPVKPSCAFALLNPTSWFWLNPLSVNLPMSLTSEIVSPAAGLALLEPAVPSAAAATQIVTTATAAAQRGILKMFPPVGKSTFVSPRYRRGS